MATELRWILLGLSCLLLAGIWWWGRRRSRQAPGNAELRESAMGSSGAPAHAAGSADDQSAREEWARHESAPEHRAIDTDSREWGVPPFEPLSIRTADFDHVHVVDMPMTADADPLDVTLNPDYVEHESAASTPVPPVPDAAAYRTSSPQASDAALHGTLPSVPNSAAHRPLTPQGPLADATPDGPPPENSGRFTTTPQAPNISETQRIVTVRVCAEGESRWTGTDLMAALENHGLRFGRYKVFHRKHSDGRTLFCAASLIEPGTFDVAKMPEDEFRGLTLFAVLPGPAEPVQTIDALIATAAELAETLHGTVQDSKGVLLSAERAEALREDVARFQASLTMT